MPTKLGRIANAVGSVGHFAAQKIAAAASVTGQLLNIADATVPTTFHQITVHAQGGPACHITRLWHLAVSACFGRRSQYGMVAVRGQAINATWDITGKSVTISLAYTVSGFLAQAAQRSIGPPGSTNPGSSRPQDGMELLARGPNQLTVGGGWGETVSTLGDAAVTITKGVLGGVADARAEQASIGGALSALTSLGSTLFEQDLVTTQLRKIFGDFGTVYGTRVPALDIGVPTPDLALPREASYTGNPASELRLSTQQTRG